MAIGYLGNGEYGEVGNSGSNSAASNAIGFVAGGLSKILVAGFVIICLFSALFLVKGFICCLMDGNGVMTSLCYSIVWAMLPWVPLVVMGIFQIFLPRILSAIFYIVGIPIICFYLLLTLPAVGHGKDPHDWMEMTHYERCISLAEDAERSLAIAKANPNSYEAKQAREFPASSPYSYESQITKYRTEAAELMRQWEIKKAEQPSFLQPFYPRP